MAITAEDGLEVMRRAFYLAVDGSISAIEGCDCRSCNETRDQMREWYLSEARKELHVCT